MSQIEANAAAQAIANYGLPTQLRACMSTAAALTTVRVEHRSGSGDLLTVGEHALLSPVVGTGTPVRPFQMSIVLGLRTNIPGRSGRGRMYWPALAIPINNVSLRVADTAITALLGALSTLFANVQGILGTTTPAGTAFIAVRSDKYQTEYSVEYYEMGDILDVQRRRRDKAVESRFTVPWA